MLRLDGRAIPGSRNDPPPQSEVHLAVFTIRGAEAPLSGGNETPLLLSNDTTIEPGALPGTNYSEDSVGSFKTFQKLDFGVLQCPKLILSA